MGEELSEAHLRRFFGELEGVRSASSERRRRRDVQIPLLLGRLLFGVDRLVGRISA